MSPSALVPARRPRNWVALFEAGDAIGALRETEQILKDSPDNVDALYNLGAIQGNMNNMEKAREYFTRCRCRPRFSQRKAGTARFGKTRETLMESSQVRRQSGLSCVSDHRTTRELIAGHPARDLVMPFFFFSERKTTALHDTLSPIECSRSGAGFLPPLTARQISTSPQPAKLRGRRKLI